MDKLILITLLIKLGVAAAIASALVRAREFQKLLYAEDRTITQKIYLVLFMCLPFALGVEVRHGAPNFLAADLSLEAVMLMGVMGGQFAGVVGALVCSLPALLHGEYLALPFNITAAFVAGTLRSYANDVELIWSFSPFVDLSLYRWIRKVVPRPKIDWQILFFFAIMLMQLLRWELGRLFSQ